MASSSWWPSWLGSMRVRIVAAVVVLLAGSSAVSILVLRAVLLDRLDDEIRLNLRQEVAEFELLAGGLDPRTGLPFGPDLAALFDVYFSREVPDEGETLLAFVGADLYRAERSQDAVPAGRLDDAIAYWRSLTQREEGLLETSAGSARYVALPLVEGGQDGLFVAANFPRFERSEIHEAVWTQAATQGVTIAVASLLGLLLAGRVLKPLRSLADTAQTITETDLTRRIPLRGRDEASRIAGAFNDMLARLEAAFGTQRQFLDEASHELRAPLTIIRGHVELLELEADPAEREATIALVTDEIERMSRIVEDLLVLARAERPGFLTREAVDIAELTEDVVRKAAVLCHRTWELESVANVVCAVDRQRLTQAMMQLADNACRYTLDDDPIRVGSRFEDGRLTLWVHDTGVGVAPEDAQRIFQRFVKGPDRAEGSGLGLSIVEAIAEAHGGTARVIAQAAPGARFEVTIPCGPETLAPGSPAMARSRS